MCLMMQKKSFELYKIVLQVTVDVSKDIITIQITFTKPV